MRTFTEWLNEFTGNDVELHKLLYDILQGVSNIFATAQPDHEKINFQYYTDKFLEASKLPEAQQYRDDIMTAYNYYDQAILGFIEAKRTSNFQEGPAFRNTLTQKTHKPWGVAVDILKRIMYKK